MDREHEQRFFLCVLESPLAKDNGLAEGPTLEAAAKLASLPCFREAVTSEALFRQELVLAIHKGMQRYPGRVPIIHLAAHGAQSGVAFFTKPHLTWQPLRRVFTLINRIFNGKLLVCLSSCYSFAGVQMAMVEEGQELPFLAMVGHEETFPFADSAIGFATFYHHLARGRTVANALEAMKVASSNDGWAAMSAANIQRGYLDFVRDLEVAQIVQELEALIRKGPL